MVDNEQTSRMLIDKKDCLRSRYTFLPLTKLGSVRCTEADKVARAKDIAVAKGTTASLALELVGYDAEVQKAMELVFGSTIVCGTAEVAKEIMQKLRLKTVTLDGDVFDPAGTMSGGAKNQLGTLLSKMTDLSTATAQLHVQQQELTSVEAILTRLESQGANHSPSPLNHLPNDPDTDPPLPLLVAPSITHVPNYPHSLFTQHNNNPQVRHPKSSKKS